MSIEQARQIFKDYAEPNSTIDSGNLYWALGVALQVIAEAEKQEPVACAECDGMGFIDGVGDQCRQCNGDGNTSPPQRQPLTEWRTIETAKIAEEVIVWSEFHGVCAGVLDSYGDWYIPYSEYKLTKVRMWMPLPPPPIEGAHGITGEKK